MFEYPLDHCPECGEEIKTGTLRWNGEGWEHKSREAHGQAGHHRVQILKKYPKILRWDSERRGFDSELPGYPVGSMEDEVFVQEKMDGCSFRFGIREGDFVFGSKKYVWAEEEVGKQFRSARDYVLDNVDKEKMLEYRDKFGKLTVFGENMILHNIDYDWDYVPQVVGFDVYSHEKGEFLHPEKARDVMQDIGLTVVPFKEITDASEIDWDDYRIGTSKYRTGEPEGVVVKNPETGMRAKILHDDFKEHNELSFGYTKSHAETDEERIVAEFCPNQRIIKQLQKQVNEEGRSLTMEEMMGEAQVHNKVLVDMFEEELEGIVHRGYEVNFRDLKRIVSDRTRKVLKRRINIKEQNDLTDQEALSMEWDQEVELDADNN